MYHLPCVYAFLPLETSIALEIINNASNVLEGESLRFGCNVRSGFGPQSRLSVAWHLVDKLNRRSEIVRLDREGTLQPGPSYTERSSYGGIQVEQVRPGSFTLEIFNSIKADEGHYECRVAEWTRMLDGEWQMVGERHTGTPVSITALGEYLRRGGPWGRAPCVPAPPRRSPANNWGCSWHCGLCLPAQWRYPAAPSRLVQNACMLCCIWGQSLRGGCGRSKARDG